MGGDAVRQHRQQPRAAHLGCQRGGRIPEVTAFHLDVHPADLHGEVLVRDEQRHYPASPETGEAGRRGAAFGVLFGFSSPRSSSLYSCHGCRPPLESASRRTSSCPSGKISPLFTACAGRPSPNSAENDWIA